MSSSFGFCEFSSFSRFVLCGFGGSGGLFGRMCCGISDGMGVGCARCAVPVVSGTRSPLPHRHPKPSPSHNNPRTNHPTTLRRATTLAFSTWTRGPDRRRWMFAIGCRSQLAHPSPRRRWESPSASARPTPRALTRARGVQRMNEMNHHCASDSSYSRVFPPVTSQRLLRLKDQQTRLGDDPRSRPTNPVASICLWDTIQRTVARDAASPIRGEMDVDTDGDVPWRGGSAEAPIHGGRAGIDRLRTHGVHVGGVVGHSFNGHRECSTKRHTGR